MFTADYRAFPGARSEDSVMSADWFSYMARRVAMSKKVSRLSILSSGFVRSECLVWTGRKRRLFQYKGGHYRRQRYEFGEYPRFG